MKRIIKHTLVLTILSTVFTALPTINANAHSVCGLRNETASFRTSRYLITICPGEASLQMILLFPDGTGYQKMPAQREGNRFRATDGKRNYIVDRQVFVIGIDGEQPTRLPVTRANISR